MRKAHPCRPTQEYLNAASSILQADEQEIDLSRVSITLSVNDQRHYAARWQTEPMTLNLGSHEVHISSDLSRSQTDGLDNDERNDLYPRLASGPRQYAGLLLRRGLVLHDPLIRNPKEIYKNGNFHA